MSNELVVSNSSFLPVMHVETAVQRFSQLAQFVGQIMKDGKDFGVIPGTGDKPTLYKPGAEKLTTFFGLSPEFVVVEKETDWTGKDHDGEPFFYFHYRCRMLRDGHLMGEGLGSCNSWETKYRFRNASKICPNCGKETIIKGKSEYGGGWLCFGRKGGCGAKFRDGDASIENQPSGKVKHDNPADIVNTIDKMAQKRALVAATLIAVNASDFFTQDIEDYVVDAPVIDITPTPPHASVAPVRHSASVEMSEPAQVTTPPKQNGNGGNGKKTHLNSAQQKIWDQVQAATDYYNDYWHAMNAIGGQPALNDPDEWPAIVSMCVDYAIQKRTEPDAGEYSQPSLDDVFGPQQSTGYEES